MLCLPKKHAGVVLIRAGRCLVPNDPVMQVPQKLPGTLFVGELAVRLLLDVIRGEAGHLLARDKGQVSTCVQRGRTHRPCCCLSQETPQSSAILRAQRRQRERPFHLGPRCSRRWRRGSGSRGIPCHLRSAATDIVAASRNGRSRGPACPSCFHIHAALFRLLEAVCARSATSFRKNIRLFIR